ncbi:MAG: 4-alpha-glucanotransferase [Chloroflexota bacterium]|nr:4-alpha-glucanotransferase [Chloroflexota bacterium]
MSSFSSVRFLHQLARLYSIQTAYYDVNHHRQQASEESLLAALRSLGAPLVNLQDVPSAWRERQQVVWQKVIEPVIVAWNGEAVPVEVRLPRSAADANLNCHLDLETGEEMKWEWRGANLSVVGTAEIEGTQYVVKQLRLPKSLPWGYHRLTVEMPGVNYEALVVSAPLRAYLPPGELTKRNLGVFLPLYALHTERSWGGGDFSDLEELIEWFGEIGGHLVATLPLLTTVLDDAIGPSPYLPDSRLLWSEFYLDVTRVPELQECPSAQALIASSSFQNEIDALRNLPLVDYQRQMALKRRVLQELSGYCFAQGAYRLEELWRFSETNRVVEDYARFRATFEKQRAPWRAWPQPLRDGIIKDGDFDEENRRYHLYVQWLVHQQMRNVLETAGGKGLQLYLDLPLGVHPDGYDVWRERDAVVLGASAGAPPDAVFTRGQNWEFPPLHPEKIREQGYRYLIACLRHHFQYAGILRIDHVMGLHRLFCISNGMEACNGVYLRYRAEELYAILSLESHRNKTVIVGEDLGTVPTYIRQAMRKHGLHRMYVVHYELASNPKKGLPPVSRDSVASLNTHDMPPFASFWQSLDIEKRLELGLLDKAGVRSEKKDLIDMKRALITFLQGGGWLQEQREDTIDVLKACLAFLAISPARIVLINLEDMWLETQPQNVPSTKAEYPNWRRRTRYTLEEYRQMTQVLDTLWVVNKLRQQSEQQ